MTMGIGSLFKKIFSRLAPEPVTRTPDEQARVDRECHRLILYHFPGCPFCSRVNRGVDRLALDMERRDIRQSDAFAEELANGGGKLQVPCLRIEDDQGDIRWLYESKEINAYLERRFG